ncbi:MAG: fatty acid desaturase family protein [Oligoflexus sp.]
MGTARQTINHEFQDDLHNNSRFDSKQMQDFANELDNIYRRIESEIGEKDLDYIKRVSKFSKTMEFTGRSLIHFSLDPLTFGTGVIALWLHKQLETTEIGHSVLHGAYDKYTTSKAFHSKSFRWDIPIDEESWRYGHNFKHHTFTNIVGKDPDTHFGIVRLNSRIPHQWVHYIQLPIGLFLIVPNFSFSMNAHFTGLLDIYDIFSRKSRRNFDFLKSLSLQEILSAHRKAFRKYIPYYTKNYVFYPMLAGPFFLKVLFGNWLAELMRDIYSSATIFCGHVGADTQAYDEDTKSLNRGEWFAMQIEASNNFEVTLPLSILCGALNRQIEHHLFPKLPPNRLREIAPEVQAVCERFGVDYRTDTWPNTLKKVVKQIAVLSVKK